MGCDIAGCENLIWDWKFPEQNKKEASAKLVIYLIHLVQDRTIFSVCPRLSHQMLIFPDFFYSVKNVLISNQIK